MSHFGLFARWIHVSLLPSRLVGFDWQTTTKCPKPRSLFVGEVGMSYLAILFPMKKSTKMNVIG